MSTVRISKLKVTKGIPASICSNSEDLQSLSHLLSDEMIEIVVSCQIHRKYCPIYRTFNFNFHSDFLCPNDTVSNTPCLL